MKSQANNLHGERWTDDPAQQEKFLTEVGPRIDRESKYMAGIYGVDIYWEDIASKVRIELLQQMLKVDADGPLAKTSPEEAADFFLEEKNYRIRERARWFARKIAKRRSRQAEILEDVRQPDLPQDIQTQLLDAAESIRRISSAVPAFTSRDREIFCKETLRQMGIDDLSAASFDQAAQAAGASSFEVRAYLKYHEQNGHSSESDRKAWSRARAKVAKAFDLAKLISLLVIIFALSLALLNAIHQDRSISNNDFVHQGSLIDENALAHQGNLINENALAHQGNLINEVALAHQGSLIDEVALTHQGSLIDENALAHQGNFIDQIALAHQGNFIQEALDA